MFDIPPQLLQAIQVIAPTTGAVVIFKQFVSQIAGAATEELVEYLHEGARFRSFKRQITMLSKAQE